MIVMSRCGPIITLEATFFNVLPPSRSVSSSLSLSYDYSQCELIVMRKIHSNTFHVCTMRQKNAPTRKSQFLRNVWIFLHQILLFCSTHNYQHKFIVSCHIYSMFANVTKNKFCNWTNIDFSFQLGCDVSECDVKNHPIYMIFSQSYPRKLHISRL